MPILPRGVAPLFPILATASKQFAAGANNLLVLDGTLLLEDGFSGRYFVRFVRGSRGAVTGMEVSVGDRVRRVHFERAR